jgi:formylglycine-generating enzyme required for sulfatase activity
MCTAGVCTINECASHYGNCDNEDANGCEVALWTDPVNCSACGFKCSATGGTPSCISGMCQIACGDGHANCDGEVSNGCEIALLTDLSNCNGCGNVCADGKVCSDGTCIAPSCASGATGQADCGPNNNESCCTSLPVPGGTVKLDDTHSATVNAFKLDKYEVTVGRFRKFVDAWVGGWRPAAGAGKHVHLNGGNGLSDGSGGYEPGWDTAWSAELGANKSVWDTNLLCDASNTTWTSEADGNERRPINCTTWFEQAAFCIWDGGFLPSEAEWQYAAAGGDEGRQYPWSNPPSSTVIDCTYANYWGCGSGTNNVGSESPRGDGRWGHSGLAGNVSERVLDWYESPYAFLSSINYADTTPASARVVRGGQFWDGASGLLASGRFGGDPPLRRHVLLGVRCARPAP